MNSTQQDTSHSRSFLTSDELEKCCGPEKKPDCDDEPKECLEQWKDKLGDAHEKMTVAQACYSQAQNTHAKAEAWENTLETWKAEAEDTHEKALAVYRELCQFIEAVKRTKTADTANAVKAVLCLVKSIFDDVDKLLYISKSKKRSDDGDKAQLYWLKYYIECNDRLDAAKKEKALGCISTFEEQMKLVQAERDKLLTNLLQILHNTNALVEAVNKQAESGAKVGNTSEDAGLYAQLQDLYDRIAGKTTDPGEQRKQVCVASLSAPDSQCKSTITVRTPTSPPPPGHLFPIRAEGINGSCDSPYYLEITKLYEQAETETGKAKALMEEKHNAYNDAKAYHDGLKDAIKASEDAKPSK